MSLRRMATNISIIIPNSKPIKPKNKWNIFPNDYPLKEPIKLIIEMIMTKANVPIDA